MFQNLQVECEKVRCLKLEGCHAILFGQPNDRCCEQCKGCRANGTDYRSGDIWSHPSDPCQRRHCRAGVITESTERCFAHCHSPVPVSGQCCPVCPGCTFRGQKYKEGDTFKLSTDPCTQCVCQNGSISCPKTSCPVLNCPKSVIYQPKGECCPKCKGMRRIFDVPFRCYFAKQIYRRGQMFQPDSCTKCTCRSGTSLCSRVTCPSLDCPAEERSRTEGGCCETCPVRRHCTYHGTKRAHKEEWMVNACMTCSCDHGVTYCQRERCSNSLWCPQGYQLRLTKDACCPKCVEHDAVCTVFGDPHYRTFDGRMFNFQGGCKYLLVRDCHRHTFTIKVRNGVRFNSGFAWTQMLAVFIGNSRISLLQNLRVKVNRKRVSLPFVKAGSFSIRRTGNSVRLRTQLGVDVVWDGDSFLEVTVSNQFKNKLCGLCGNYNGLKSDDLTGSDGTMYTDGEEYGKSWRIGSKRACKTNPRVDTKPLCEKDENARQRANRVCSVFYEHSLQPCRRVLPVRPYVTSCITDMCDCPPGRYCACEALKAYLSQCRRAGASIPWGRHRKCFPPPNCPNDAKTVQCSDACPRTCSNLNSLQPCPAVCEEGCLCNDGKVFHKEACIEPELCPRSSS
ncbi:hypothetical protein V1264_011373 [Littorina saxatilis]|uniref:BMP-binding endothelial regulator protein n=1 Tax=Littorina saxatilis TaxID=31220 RepID=A0AAN9GK70_9CAEN